MATPFHHKPSPEKSAPRRASPTRPRSSPGGGALGFRRVVRASPRRRPARAAPPRHAADLPGPDPANPGPRRAPYPRQPRPSALPRAAPADAAGQCLLPRRFAKPAHAPPAYEMRHPVRARGLAAAPLSSSAVPWLAAVPGRGRRASPARPRSAMRSRLAEGQARACAARPTEAPGTRSRPPHKWTCKPPVFSLQKPLAKPRALAYPAPRQGHRPARHPKAER